jgi:hypothetical protein
VEKAPPKRPLFNPIFTPKSPRLRCDQNRGGSEWEHTIHLTNKKEGQNFSGIKFWRIVRVFL